MKKTLKPAAYQTQGWGLAALVVAYTLVYINGIRVQWGGK